MDRAILRMSVCEQLVSDLLSKRLRVKKAQRYNYQFTSVASLQLSLYKAPGEILIGGVLVRVNVEEFVV